MTWYHIKRFLRRSLWGVSYRMACYPGGWIVERKWRWNPFWSDSAPGLQKTEVHGRWIWSGYDWTRFKTGEEGEQALFTAVWHRGLEHKNARRREQQREQCKARTYTVPPFRSTK